MTDEFELNVCRGPLLEYHIELVLGPHDGLTYDLIKFGPCPDRLAWPLTFYIARFNHRIVCTDDALKSWVPEQVAGCFLAYRGAGRFTTGGREGYEWRR